MTAFYLGLRIQACKYFILEIAFVLMFRVEMAQKVFVVWVVLVTVVLNVEIMVGSAPMELDCRWVILRNDNYFCVIGRRHLLMEV